MEERVSERAVPAAEEADDRERPAVEQRDDPADGEHGPPVSRV